MALMSLKVNSDFHGKGSGHTSSGSNFPMTAGNMKSLMEFYLSGFQIAVADLFALE
jgi:hypothetical protein